MAAVLAHQPPDGSTYTFASQPRAVPNRKKYRDDVQNQEADAAAKRGNIMYDRRVIRGNTYSQHVLPAVAQPDPVELQRQQELRRRALARKRLREQLKPRSPDAVEGRKHIDIQTELYLEELADRIEEADAQCQTDSFMDRPPSPMFIPAKSGEDKHTQILLNELFDFDLEVKPILEVLVGKTVEQSLLEVCSEEELASLRRQQREFEERRNAELVEAQRLEEQDRRHRQEKERRLHQQREEMEKEKETATKIAAHAFAQSYLADLVPSVFGSLAQHGYFYDPVQRDLEVGLLPWLMSAVCNELDTTLRARTLLDGLLRELVNTRHSEHRGLEDKLKQQQLEQQMQQAAELQQQQQQEEEKKPQVSVAQKDTAPAAEQAEALVEVEPPTPPAGAADREAVANEEAEDNGDAAEEDNEEAEAAEAENGGEGGEEAEN